MGGGNGYFEWGLVLILYFVPYFLWSMHTRDREKLLVVFITNFGLGWTGFFWLMLLFALYLERRGLYLWGGDTSVPPPSTSVQPDAYAKNGRSSANSEPAFQNPFGDTRSEPVKPPNLLFNPKVAAVVVGLIAFIEINLLTATWMAAVLGLVAGFVAYLAMKMVVGLMSKSVKKE